jgi:RimJ/RimL family protein N-acetyltransferase
MLDHADGGCQGVVTPLGLVPLNGRHARDLGAFGRDLAALAGVDALAFVERAQRLRARGTQATFAVCDAARLLGVVLLARDATVPERAELGYWIAPQERGRGYATAAARQLVDHGLSRMGLTLITARCPSDNPASIRVLEKLGFNLVAVETAGIRRYELP